MTTHLQTSAATVPTRDRFATGQTLFLPGIHLGAMAAVWHSNWAAVAACLSLHVVFDGLGICVGYHRLLTYRSFKCPRSLQYALTLPGCFCLEGKPVY